MDFGRKMSKKLSRQSPGSDCGQKNPFRYDVIQSGGVLYGNENQRSLRLDLGKYQFRQKNYHIEQSDYLSQQKRILFLDVENKIK